MAGFDRLHMEPSGASGAVEGLDREATTFSEAWGGAKRAIGRTAGQLGRGPLGQSFMSAYSNTAEQLIRDVDDWPSNLKYAARAGYRGVLDYQDADQRSARGFPGGK